eukprot:2921066-Rhodomonas_salina.6
MLCQYRTWGSRGIGREGRVLGPRRTRCTQVPGSNIPSISTGQRVATAKHLRGALPVHRYQLLRALRPP